MQQFKDFKTIESLREFIELKIPMVPEDQFDPAHDIGHIKRVTNLAILISEKDSEGDPYVLIPAVLFHDAVTYRKDDPRNKYATEESAKFAENILKEINYPEHLINHVKQCILECSFSKNLKPTSIESAILQDADRLEATGAISLMRTFSSGGQMQRPFYNTEDPFREKSSPENTEFSLDLLYKRLFVVTGMMNTKTGKEIALRRNQFLKDFENELKQELSESGVYFGLKSETEKGNEWYQRRHDDY